MSPLFDTAPSILIFGLASGLIAAVFLWALLAYERVKQVGLREIESLVERKRQVIKEKMEMAPTDLSEAFMKEVRAAAGSDAAMPDAVRSFLAEAMASKSDRGRGDSGKGEDTSVRSKAGMKDRAKRAKMRRGGK